MIKSDHWIRRMAAEQRMIEPFEPGQVREANGRKIVSYGTSSYGYDIRCSNEFKLFTNLNTTIVDPKNFDDRSFVDFTGDSCIIPPNSFALARTVEYFRIPRNVLTICLGKCLAADTRVVDADTGAWLRIADFSAAKKTLGLDGWQVQGAPVSGLLAQGKRPVFALRTRAGLTIKATANHPFRQLHGWTPLDQLVVGDRIAVARHLPVFGRTAIPDWEVSLLGFMIARGQCNAGSPTFTSADPVVAQLLKRAVAGGALGEVTRKGRYGYRLVDRVGRGGRAEHNRAARWLNRHQLNVAAGAKFVPQCVFTAPREAVRLFLQALFSGDGSLYRHGESFLLEYDAKSRRLIEDVHHLLLRFGVFSLLREKITAIGTQTHSIQITDAEQIIRFADRIGFCPGSSKQRRLEDEIVPLLRASPIRLRSSFDTLPLAAWHLLGAAVARAGAGGNRLALKTNSAPCLPFTLLSRVAAATGDDELPQRLEGPVWDVVEAIESAGEEDVFDISVPWLHNFFANDIVVHNSTYARCGIIVNVTPLEPEWEGYVTLEFSNTTPLPAKIYANEGVAQVIFFESDEVCETSYKDRGGKYQGQKGVTLPKI